MAVPRARLSALAAGPCDLRRRRDRRGRRVRRGIVICPSTEANLATPPDLPALARRRRTDRDRGSDSQVARCWTEELRWLERPTAGAPRAQRRSIRSCRPTGGAGIGACEATGECRAPLRGRLANLVRAGLQWDWSSAHAPIRGPRCRAPGLLGGAVAHARCVVFATDALLSGASRRRPPRGRRQRHDGATPIAPALPPRWQRWNDATSMSANAVARSASHCAQLRKPQKTSSRSGR